jgi:chaperonin GroES
MTISDGWHFVIVVTYITYMWRQNIMLVERMLNDNCLISPLTAAEEVTPGGVVLPQKSREKRGVKGLVMAVGPGLKLDSGDRFPTGIKPGSIVLFAEKSGDTVLLDSKEYLVIPERFLLGVISEPENLPDAESPDDSLVEYTFEDGEPIDIGDDNNNIEGTE